MADLANAAKDKFSTLTICKAICAHVYTDRHALNAQCAGVRDMVNVYVNPQSMVNLYRRSIFALMHYLPPKSKIHKNKAVGKSACGCNNNAATQKELFSRFPPSTYAGNAGQVEEEEEEEEKRLY